MTSAERLQPRRNDPPPGWSREVFERLTDALAAALVVAVRRAVEEADTEAVEQAASAVSLWRPYELAEREAVQ